MKLSKILKNRKAMTPLMIGIIVAASVITVLFIVMAAVIPAMNNEVSMQVRSGTVKPYENASKGLEFIVMCDYANGEVWRVEILRDDVIFATRTLSSTIEIERNNQSKIQISSFLVTQNTPAGQQDNSQLLFFDTEEYTIRIYYRPVNSEIVNLYSDFTFVYDA